jgi:phosphate transport system permease protein
LGIAVFLVEQAPHYISRPCSFLVDLLAAIPSVVYGVWGIFVLAPFLRVYVEPPLSEVVRLVAAVSGTDSPGIGLLTGGLFWRLWSHRSSQLSFAMFLPPCRNRSVKLHWR